jgi:hypothetical protein
MLRLLDYEAFGRLRFLDYFPKTEIYYCNDVGGIMTQIGYSCVEGYADNAFAWRGEPPIQTGVVNVCFGDECPYEFCQKLLDTIGLPLKEGMSRQEVCDLLGAEDSASEGSDRFARFIVGEPDAFYVFCGFDVPGGLNYVGVSRKDLTDENNREMGIV